MEKRGPSHTVFGNINCAATVETSTEVPIIEFPYDPAIPLLGIYPDKTIIQKDPCTPMFIAALFTIAKRWKQPKCPLTHEWVNKTWYINTMEYYSPVRKNKRMPSAETWMQSEIIIQNKVRKTNIVWFNLYVDSKICHKWTYIQNKNRIMDTEKRLMAAKQERVKGGMEWEAGVI